MFCLLSITNPLLAPSPFHLRSAARNDVGHQVGVDPFDDTGINVSNLEERGHLRVSGSAIHPDHTIHAPRMAALDVIDV